MFYYFLSELTEFASFFNVFRYITFRSFGAMITAFALTVFLFPPFLQWLRKLQKGRSNIREDVPENHLQKSGTPTMGGLLILAATLFTFLLWGNWEDSLISGALFALIGFGIIGMIDDFQKLRNHRTGKGISGRNKLLLESIIAILAFGFIHYGFNLNTTTSLSTVLTFPFFKEMILPLGGWFLLVVIFVMVGSANAVNLTDGLDGLAIGPVLVVSAVFGIITYLAGNAIYANYLQIHYVAGAGELAVLCAAIIGAGLGFLWFNAPPAMVFMGDTGSLALGGVLGYIAIATKHEIVLGIAGFLFVIEALSVMLQVSYFKYTKGKRIFLMTPIHHHYEKKGWAETHIVIRFWIIAGLCGLLALSTLKLR